MENITIEEMILYQGKALYDEIEGAVKSHAIENFRLAAKMVETEQCVGVTVIGYLSGEHVTDFDAGCPIVLRDPTGSFTLANFLRAQLYSTLASLAFGLQILKRENVSIDLLTAHGGLFKTPKVAQQFLADAINVPVEVMKTTAEGGAYGMALLAAYRANCGEGETLENYLDKMVFANARRSVLAPNDEGVSGFKTYLERFEKALKVERAAIGGF